MTITLSQQKINENKIDNAIKYSKESSRVNCNRKMRSDLSVIKSSSYLVSRSRVQGAPLSVLNFPC